ncbi:MAG: S8 family serine peptidase [Rhodothalassiaceae bacterium]
MQTTRTLALLALAATGLVSHVPESGAQPPVHHVQRIERLAQHSDRVRDGILQMKRAARLERLRQTERALIRRWIEHRVGRSVAQRRAAARRAFIVTRDGSWVVRGEILALGLDPQKLAAARARGLTVLRRRPLEALGLDLVVLGVPRNRDTIKELRNLRTAIPGARFELNHVFDPSGADSMANKPEADVLDAPMPWSDLPPLANGSLGLVDLGVDPTHPALRNTRIELRSFTGEKEPSPSAHGTAVASLLVGAEGRFAGAAQGAHLLAADVFGDADTGGSAEMILEALDWLAKEQVPVIAMPLVGPPNLLLEASLAALHRRGVLVVAPVGNGGPTRPVAYPAAYADVIAVTATDAGGKVFIAAQRGPEVMFSAVGVRLPAAADPERLKPVEGTSFAVPEVAARLLRALPAPEPTAAERALSALERTAVDLGAPGHDPVYGYGWVSFGGRSRQAQKMSNP